MNEIQSTKLRLTEALSSYYPPEEAEHLSRLLIEEAFGYPYPQLVVGNYKVTEKIALIDGWVDRLLKHEPIQYILGRVSFGGYELYVAPGVLIPRPETEEMCKLIEERHLVQRGSIVADVCSGSGAIALYMSRRGAIVDAVEVSKKAARIASINFSNYATDIHLSVEDIFASSFKPQRAMYDLVVSNPPYVLERERNSISSHVLTQEPSLALFVPDDDPVIFYRRIVETYLSKTFVFEINPLCISKLKDVFEGRSIEFLKDFRGHIRYLIVQ